MRLPEIVFVLSCTICFIHGQNDKSHDGNDEIKYKYNASSNN